MPFPSSILSAQASLCAKLISKTPLNKSLFTVQYGHFKNQMARALLLFHQAGLWLSQFSQNFWLPIQCTELDSHKQLQFALHPASSGRFSQHHSPPHGWGGRHGSPPLHVPGLTHPTLWKENSGSSLLPRVPWHCPWQHCHGGLPAPWQTYQNHCLCPKIFWVFPNVLNGSFWAS